MSEEVQCCPDCGSSSVRYRGGGFGCRRPEEKKWHCEDCGARHDEIDTREAKSDTEAPGGTLAKKLEEMNPPEVHPADD